MKRFISLLLTAVLMINFLCPAVLAEEITTEEIISAEEMVSEEEIIPLEETISSEEKISTEEPASEETVTEEITSEEAVYAEEIPAEEIITEDAEPAEEIITEEITDDISADNANSWRYKDGKPINDQYAVMPVYVASHPEATFTGIDVSKHQGQIDWAKVKQAGIDFAIIRCGYGEDKSEYDDIWWDYNASECERLGIPYGVYLYSYAESITDALSEAEHVLRLIEGRNLSLPVFYDMEDHKLMGHDLAAMANVFCDRISEMGHPVGVYASLSWWDYHLINPCFDNWYKWVAQWNEGCEYTGDYTIWQYSSTGAVSGIANNVDMNYLIGYPYDHKVWTEKLDTPTLNIDSAVSGHPLISWNDVQWAKEYQIWRKAGNDYYSLIDTVTETSFTDYGVAEGTEYAYMVKAVSLDNKTGNSYFSNAKGMKYVHRHTYKGIYCDVCGEKHPEADNYKGKVISVLGDSISTFEGYIPTDDGFNLKHLARYPQDNLLTDVNETWWMQVINSFGAKLGINDSWRGATMCGAVPVTSGVSGELSSMSNLQRIRNLGSNGKPDVIMLYGGTNDIAHVEKIGTFNEETAPEEADLETLKWDNLADGYVNTILRLKHFYPDSDIIALLPAYTKDYYTEEKLTLANEVISKICEHYGVKYTDLTESGITADNLPDGIHPDAAGMDYISDAVINLLLENCTVSAGENIVYKIEHHLTNVKADFSYIKGISAGQSFEEELAAEDEISVKVSMAGTDITSESFKDNKIFIENVTGDIVISAMSGYSIEEYIKPLPEKMCPEINIWQAVEHSNYYFTANNKWEIHSSGNIYSVTVPLSANDRIYATSFGKAGENGSSTTNGIRVVFFGDYGVIKNLSAEETYTEFSQNGYITAPKGTIAISVPMWNNSDINEMYILTAEHDHTVVSGTEPTCIEKGVIDYKCAVCSLEYQENKDALGHSFTQYTFNGDGTKTSKCDRCNETETVKDKVYSGEYGDNIYWFIDSADTLYVYGNGEMQDFAESDIPWYEYRTIVKKAVIENTVTSIGTYAFVNFTSLEKVTIPDSVTEIGAEAFDSREISFTVNKNSAAHKWLEENGFTNLDVKIALEGISLPANIDIRAGESTKLKAELYPSDTTDAINPEWTTEDESVAVYDKETSQLNAVGPGITSVTITDANSGFSATATVNVKLPDRDNMTIGLAEDSEEISATGLELGDSRKLSVTSASAGKISADKLVFASSNPKSLTVDENGVITSGHTSQTATTVTVTASLKNDPAEKAVFKVKVSAKLAKEVPVEIGTAEAVNGYNMEAVQIAENLWTVTVPYEMVKKGALTFEVSGKLDESAFEAVNAKAPGVSWSTDNKAVAAVKTVSAEEGYKAQITVPKGANGTATVTVTAKDAGKASTAIEIDVRDYTPRLGSNTVTLNTYMKNGAEIKLYKAYDAEIINISEEKTVELKGDDRFFAEYDAEKSAVIISTAETVANNSKGIKLTLAVNTKKGLTEQQITVKVSNKLPKVTVKQNGVFNTFCTDSEVFTEVSTKEAQITDIQLKETESFAGEYTAAAEGQPGGIKVKWAEDKAGTKADTAAVLEVSFEGYRETAKLKYTVSAKETKPNLVLSKTSNVYSYLNMNSEPVMVKDKATGEVKDISTLSWKVTSAEGYAEVTEAEGGLKFTPVLNENNRFADNKTSHTVKFEIKAENWVKAIGFSYKLTVDTAKPSVSTKNGTVVLRTMYADEAEIVFKANKANCPEPVRYEYANAAKAGSSAYEEAEKITFRSEGWKVYAGLKTESMPKAGSYSFKVTAVVNNAQGEEVKLNAVTVKVTVSDTKPTVSIKPATVQLDGTKSESGSVTVIPNDSSCPEPEYNITPDTKNASVLAQMEKIDVSGNGWQITAKFKDISDMPANGSYRYKVTPIINTAAGEEALKPAYFVVKVSTPAAAVKVNRTSVTVNPKINESVSIVTTVNAGYTVTGIEKVSVPEGINVSWNDGEITVSAEGTKNNGTYSCTVKPEVKLNREDAQPVTGKAITVKVTVRNGNVGINTTAKGNMDLLFRDKGITYTVTGGSNFNYSADRLTGEFSLKGSYNGTDICELFEIGKTEKNSKGQWTVEVKAVEGAAIKADTVYKYRIAAELTEGGTAESRTDISVRTKQTGLKLKVISDTTVYHRHENGVITVGVSSPKDARIADIQVLDTRATTVPEGAIVFGEAVANADGSWTVDYEIVRASRIKVGKSYKVAFAVTPEGNATNKTPQTYTVTLKVKR